MDGLIWPPTPTRESESQQRSEQSIACCTSRHRQNVKDTHNSWDNLLMKLYALTSMWVIVQMGCCCSMLCNRKGSTPVATVTEEEHFLSLLEDGLTSPTAPLWSACFPLLSLTFLHLKIKSTDGQIALFFFSFLHHLLLAQVYFGVISSAKRTGSSICELLPVCLFWSLCDCEPHAACACAHAWLLCVYLWVRTCCLSRRRLRLSKCHVTWSDDISCCCYSGSQTTCQPASKQISNDKDSTARRERRKSVLTSC